MDKKTQKAITFNQSFIGGIMALSIGDMLLQEMSKMIGKNEIPKGVVKELKEGVMDGLLSHFHIQIEQLKEDNKRLEEERSKLIEELGKKTKRK